MTYTNFENGDNRLDIRTKINNLGNNTVSEVTALELKNVEQDGRIDNIEETLEQAYCCYSGEPDMVLTNTFQKLTTFTEIVTPVNVSLTDGVFTANKSGLYQWVLERGYTNEDSNPSSPIEITIEIRKNSSNVVYSRTAIIGAATSNDEPATVTFTSPFIMNVLFNDTFEFYFKANEGASSPLSTMLNRIQLSANRLG